jgi:tetratricopeptide (TPR) repeat protein
MACFQAGDVGAAQPIMHLAVIQFTKAIALRPNSARSYMGRGWAYLMLNDGAHAQADFRKALRLDPGLRNQLVTEAKAILEKKCEGSAAAAMLQRMGAYSVNRDARTASQCAAVKGYWNGSECRISTAMAPGPLMLGPKDSVTGNARFSGGCAAQPNPNAPDYKYNRRAGGVFVK